MLCAIVIFQLFSPIDEYNNSHREIGQKEKKRKENRKSVGAGRAGAIDRFREMIDR